MYIIMTFKGKNGMKLYEVFEGVFGILSLTQNV